MAWRGLDFELKEEPSTEELLAWLGRVLDAEGVRVERAVEHDWGLELTLRVGPRRTLLGVGKLPDKKRTYRAFTRPPTLLDYLFGQGRLWLRSRALRALENALKKSPEVKSWRWVDL